MENAALPPPHPHRRALFGSCRVWRWRRRPCPWWCGGIRWAAAAAPQPRAAPDFLQLKHVTRSEMESWIENKKKESLKVGETVKKITSQLKVLTVEFQFPTEKNHSEIFQMYRNKLHHQPQRFKCYTLGEKRHFKSLYSLCALLFEQRSLLAKKKSSPR